MAIARFSIAVDRRFKRDGEPETDFFNCTAFGKHGEFVEKYLKQGTKILVTGRIENNNYTNKDGQKIYSTDIKVEEIEFAESKSTNVNVQEQQQPVQDNGFTNIPDDSDLPWN